MKNRVINKKIVNLWNKYFKDSRGVYAPLFYDDFDKGVFYLLVLIPYLAGVP